MMAGAPTETIFPRAIKVEGSPERVAKLYEVSNRLGARRRDLSRAARRLNLLLDNNLAPRIARSLDALFERTSNFRVARSVRAGTHQTSSGSLPSIDVVGCAALTRDLHIRTRPHERAALDRAR